MNKLYGVLLISLCLLEDSRSLNTYEVIERTETEPPTTYLEVLGSHIEVHYVMLHEGHRLHAICNPYLESCGLRPRRTYECKFRSWREQTITDCEDCKPPIVIRVGTSTTDLLCKDDDREVRLYVPILTAPRN